MGHDIPGINDYQQSFTITGLFPGKRYLLSVTQKVGNEKSEESNRLLVTLLEKGIY